MCRLRKSARSRSDRAKGSLPSRRIPPIVGRSSVPRMCSSVLLPEPDGPITARASPRCNSRLTPRSTDNGPLRVGKSLPRFSTRNDMGRPVPRVAGQERFHGKCIRFRSHRPTDSGARTKTLLSTSATLYSVIALTREVGSPWTFGREHGVWSAVPVPFDYGLRAVAEYRLGHTRQLRSCVRRDRLGIRRHDLLHDGHRLYPLGALAVTGLWLRLPMCDRLHLGGDGRRG